MNPVSEVNAMTNPKRAVTSVTRQGLGHSSADKLNPAPTGNLWEGLGVPFFQFALSYMEREKAPGIDGIKGTDYIKTATERLPVLLQELREGRWRPRPVRVVPIRKGMNKQGQMEYRYLGIPCFEDKLVQTVLYMLLDPEIDIMSLNCSYGFRPSTGTIPACQGICDTLNSWGGAHVVDVDIRTYFDSINHTKLMAMLGQMNIERAIRNVIYKFLKAGAWADGKTTPTNVGTPQGGVMSPTLSNLFLHVALDQWFTTTLIPLLGGKVMLFRYADDFVVLCQREADARYVWKAIQRQLHEFGLQLHPEKTRLVTCLPDLEEMPPIGPNPRRITSFDFLGFNFRMTTATNGHTPRVRITTSTPSWKRSLSRWNDRWDRELHILQPVELLDAFKRSLGGYLLYQSHMVDITELEAYLPKVRVKLHELLRKAKATSTHHRELDIITSPEMVPTLTNEARKRGHWHKENQSSRTWRRTVVGTPHFRPGVRRTPATEPTLQDAGTGLIGPYPPVQPLDGCIHHTHLVAEAHGTITCPPATQHPTDTASEQGD